MRYRVVYYCVAPNCRCLDRAGVIVYNGTDEAAARRVADDVWAGYAAEIDSH